MARAIGDLVAESGAVEPEDELLLRPSWNVAPTDPVPLVRMSKEHEGRVLDVAFTGVATQYVLDVPGVGTWTAYEQNLDVDATARPGDLVTVAWDLRHTFTLPSDEGDEGDEVDTVGEVGEGSDADLGADASAAGSAPVRVTSP